MVEEGDKCFYTCLPAVPESRYEQDRDAELGKRRAADPQVQVVIEQFKLVDAFAELISEQLQEDNDSVALDAAIVDYEVVI